MTLTDYYEALPTITPPKAQFTKDVVARCGVTIQCVQNWVKNGVTPSTKDHCDAIAEIVGRPAEELFPDYTKKFTADDQAE